ncbi:hypothetical protein [Paraburkholderia youngii]|uniref:Uncharacterized protein n=1 Tax=Paraburkholderia youngii TaxID=2782701 RepID=A0A7Y6N0W4_9BURK|nr:hypothetical protein [Paraburkholderia youngii]NUY04548.1 hypothetical protein [Paraburkholderia youngii]
MVIAVVAVRVMKMAVNQIIDMIAMRYWVVSAARAVDVARFMATAVWCALVRIFCANVDLVFVHVIAVRMVQMAIVQIVYVIAMLDCGVSAARAMLMVMVCVMRFAASAHACLLFPSGRTATFDGHLPTLH